MRSEQTFTGSLYVERPAVEVSAWFDWALCSLIICNGLDGVFTVLWVSAHEATEANPVMAWLLSQGAMPFLFGKMCLVGLCALMLRSKADRLFAQVGLLTVLAAYLAVMSVHLNAAQRLFS